LEPLLDQHLLNRRSKEKGTVDKVEKLLSDGLLKELVAEGAFGITSPQKK
jgi:hypothetical protein